ncbi:MAG TPA: prepilin-type N-terminal cleavage/methylation domain-containing protein [Acidimicrobiia bacterium]|nr:prepilin-type N-terminal cleavage/methylation domain-containing protein [Acidimicrobiia bacterium]
MMKNRIPSLGLHKDQKGFTLVELLVAMFVGLIVMAMSVAILGTTNSTSLRVLSKSDAQQNTRNSIGKIFASLADADSLQLCRVADSKENQEKITESPPGRPGERPLPVDPLLPTNCRETASSGNVVAWAAPNLLCYFKVDRQDGTEPSSTPANIICIGRGGEIKNIYSSTGSTTFNQDIGIKYGILDLPVLYHCAKKDLDLRPDKNFVYVFKCKSNGAFDSSIFWPGSFRGPEADVPGDISVLADLGSSLANGADPTTNLFQYTLDTETHLPDTPVPSEKLSKIVAIDIRMDINFKKTAGSVDKYLFRQTVVLRKSKAALGDEFDG